MTSLYTYAAVPSSTSSSRNEINQHNQHPHTSQPHTTYPLRPHYTRSFREQIAASAAMPFSPSSTRRNAQMKKAREADERRKADRTVEERKGREKLSFREQIKEQIAAADRRDYEACPSLLRDMYFPDFEHDRVDEEVAKEKEECEGIRTWLGGLSVAREEGEGIGGDAGVQEVEENEQEQEDECVHVEREMPDWPEVLCDFHDHEVWSVNSPTPTATYRRTSPTSPIKQIDANETEATTQDLYGETIGEDDESRLISQAFEEMNLLRFPPPPQWTYGRTNGAQYTDGETVIEIPSLEDRILGTLAQLEKKEKKRPKDK